MKATGERGGAPPVAESSDLSEWPRSTDAKERRRRRQMPGTATGEDFRADAEDEALCLCQLRTQCFLSKRLKFFYYCSNNRDLHLFSTWYNKIKRS